LIKDLSRQIYKKKGKKIMQSFSEYLDAKGKDQKKPIIDPEADTGPEPKPLDKPQKAAKKGKNWKAEAAQVDDNNQPKPYKAAGTDPGQEKYEKGLTYKGDQELVYKPKTQDLKLKIPYGTKAEHFLHILEKNNGQSVRKIIEMAEMIKSNDNLVETLVREIKRKGGFNKLVEAVLDQPETYSEIAINLSNEQRSKDISRQLAKALNEITSPPEADTIDKPASKKMPHKDDSADENGKPASPDDNVRKAKTVKDVPAEDSNIMQSKMMRPEHHLIEALASYRNLRSTMIKTLS
jgi:hypothetical protein